MNISIILKSLDINITFGIIRNPFLDEGNQKETPLNNAVTKQLPSAEKKLLPYTEMDLTEKLGQEEFVDWKAKMESDFRNWIDELKLPPKIELLDETPDVYSFYEELSVLKNEIRKGNRKNSETLSRFDNSIGEFFKAVSDIKNHLTLLEESDKGNDQPTHQKQLIMSLVEITERISRMETSIAITSKKDTPDNSNEWKPIFENIKKGISILVSHMESLLEKEGVKRIKTIGNQFDPTRMIAIAAETVEGIPDNFVSEEISPGYMFNGDLLKFAEVKVSTRKDKK